jgi:hypothetical protein
MVELSSRGGRFENAAVETVTRSARSEWAGSQVELGGDAMEGARDPKPVDGITRRNVGDGFYIVSPDAGISVYKSSTPRALGWIDTPDKDVFGGPE